MKVVSVLTVIVAVCLVGQAQGWLYGGWGGLGLGYGLGWGWPYYRYFRSTMSEGNILNRVACQYNNMSLSCSGNTGVVECRAYNNLTDIQTQYGFEMYGLGCTNERNVSEDLYRFHMYPRSTQNDRWFNYTIELGSRDVELALFHSENFDYYGYRVPELSCFRRLISLFRDASSDEPISVGSETYRLFGEVSTVAARQV